MSGESDTPAPASPSPGRPKFRGSRQAHLRLSPEEAQRQGEAARHAWSAFQDRDRVVAFLNGHDEQLGGRPIDLAIASDAGLAIVTDAIRVSAAGAGDAPSPAPGQAAAAHGPSSPTD
jgi:hypothetical protein